MEFDKSLIQKLKENDRKAQEAFYLFFAPKMFGICLRFSADSDEAQDILQEGFIRVFRYVKDYRGEGSFDGWVRRTIVNTAINHYKKRIKRSFTKPIEHAGPAAEFNAHIVEQMSADEILEVIKELPDGYRTVFNLNIIEGYTHKEIGELLGISENTSKSQLSRARIAIQKKLEKIKQKENIGK
jgi:RNA polymerase sigma-70 factor (ECF subfamily)